MMPPSHTFFKAALALLALGAPGAGGTVTGKVQIMAPAARLRGVPDIVVWLEPTTPIAATTPPARARLLQKDKMFQPHVLVVRTGTVVDFPNADPIFHNAFSTYDGQLFDVGLYPPGTNQSIRFRRPGVVRVFCNIHPSMAAVIVVVDTPFYAKASAEGDYHFSNVPQGSYQVNVYDERATAGQQGPIPIEVVNAGGAVAVPVIKLSEAGFVKAPHKNKFGGDYPPGSENSSYDGVLK